MSPDPYLCHCSKFYLMMIIAQPRIKNLCKEFPHQNILNEHAGKYALLIEQQHNIP